MTNQVIAYSQFEPVTALLAYIGMGCILLAFGLEARGLIHSRARNYLLLMAVGSFILGVRALHTGEWAFLVLEAAWMGVAVWSLFSPTDLASSNIESA